MDLPIDVVKIISTYTIKPRMKLLDWVLSTRIGKSINPKSLNVVMSANPHYIDWHFTLSLKNLNRIQQLNRDQSPVYWGNISSNPNPNVIELLEANPDKINWSMLSANPNGIPLLKSNPDKINWANLSANPNGIPLLQANQDKINWDNLSANPNGIPLLQSNPDKINWSKLSANPNGIPLLQANPDKIDWAKLSANPNGIDLLEANQDKIYWCYLSTNPNGIQLLKSNPELIQWDFLSGNPNPGGIDLLKQAQGFIFYFKFCDNPGIFELDTVYMHRQIMNKTIWLDLILT